MKGKLNSFKARRKVVSVSVFDHERKNLWLSSFKNKKFRAKLNYAIVLCKQKAPFVSIVRSLVAVLAFARRENNNKKQITTKLLDISKPQQSNRYKYKHTHTHVFVTEQKAKKEK